MQLGVRIGCFPLGPWVRNKKVEKGVANYLDVHFARGGHCSGPRPSQNPGPLREEIECALFQIKPLDETLEGTETTAPGIGVGAPGFGMHRRGGSGGWGSIS